MATTEVPTAPKDKGLARLVASDLGLSEEDLEAIQAGDVARLVASGHLGESATQLSPLLLAALMRGGEEEENDVNDIDDFDDRGKRYVMALRYRLAEAESMIGYLSDVFGACRVCWGRSSACPACRGSGAPGSKEPMQGEVLHLIEPVLERFGMRIIGKDASRKSGADGKGVE
jgi:hypothetical protein